METLLRGDSLEEHPHPILKIYLGCRRWSEPGQRVLPWDGGWLDWDFHECKWLEWLEDLVEEVTAAEKRRAEAMEKASGFFGNTGP